MLFYKPYFLLCIDICNITIKKIIHGINNFLYGDIPYINADDSISDTLCPPLPSETYTTIAHLLYLHVLP